MGKREEKITRAAHIKKHTRGTSNEISFSVLDAAKDALDGGADDKQKHAPLFGRIALFTLPGRRKKPAPTPTKERGLPLSTGDFVSVDDASPASAITTVKPVSRETNQPVKSSASLTVPVEKVVPAPAQPAKPKRSPEEEIARRKARRRLSKVLAVSAIVIITVGLLAVGGTYLYHDYQTQRGHVAVLDDALNLVGDTDSTLIGMQEIVSDPFQDRGNETRAKIQTELGVVDEKLQQADKKAREVSLELTNARDKEAANQTVIAVSARRTMIEQGQMLMDAATEAQNAYERIDEAWSTLLEADELARQAAQLVVDTTVENVEASKTKTNDALKAFDTALSAFADMQTEYPPVDLAPYIDYVQKRQESLGYALASDDAFLAKNKEEAVAQNNAYNIADAEAATLAKMLPKDPAIIVDEAFKNEIAEASKAFSTACLQAGSADAFIHDYLGAESK